MGRYRNNPHWILFTDEGRLFVSRGADSLFLVDESSQETTAAFDVAYKAENYNELCFDNKEIALVFQKLLSAGVIYKDVLPEPKPEGVLHVAIRWYGDVNEYLLELLKLFAARNNIDFTDERTADIVLMMRCAGGMLQILEEYQSINKPHLLIDMAYEHMISVGPLVIPGETACINCFVGRIVRSWGSHGTPRSPYAGHRAELIAGIIIENLKTFLLFGNCPELVNQAWVMDLRKFTTRVDRVHRLPWCENCFPDGLERKSGSFELPWRIS